MKKKQGSRIVNIAKNLFNVRKWSDFDRLRTFTLYLVKTFKTLFIPNSQKHKKGESFKHVTHRLDLSDADLAAKQKGLLRLSLFMCVIGLGIVGYSGYQFIHGSIRAGLISLIIASIAFVLAFRYHFWYFQIKERKLGCTFREWFRHGLLGEKKHE